MYPYSQRATVLLLVVTTQGNQVVQDSLFNLFRIVDARVSSSSLFFLLFFSRFSDPSSFFPETELKAGRRQHAQPYIDGDDGQRTKRRRPRVYIQKKNYNQCLLSSAAVQPRYNVDWYRVQWFTKGAPNPANYTRPSNGRKTGLELVECICQSEGSETQQSGFFSLKNKAHFWQKQTVKMFCLVKKRTREEQ